MSLSARSDEVIGARNAWSCGTEETMSIEPWERSRVDVSEWEDGQGVRQVHRADGAEGRGTSNARARSRCRDDVCLGESSRPHSSASKQRPAFPKYCSAVLITISFSRIRFPQQRLCSAMTQLMRLSATSYTHTHQSRSTTAHIREPPCSHNGPVSRLARRARLPAARFLSRLHATNVAHRCSDALDSPTDEPTEQPALAL